jgi:hypothetical protein
MIIHPYIPKRKKKKPTAKQRSLKASWENILKKYDIKPDVNKSSKIKSNYTPSKVIHRQTIFDCAPSVDRCIGNTSKSDYKQYTGDAMIGIGQLHKSNAIPIFKKEDAEDLAKMRR